MFNESDLKQFSKKGIRPETIEMQINQLTVGFPYINIIKAATSNDGILSLPDIRVNELVKLYENRCNHESIVKFVPASGAASRMFKSLYEFKEGKSSLKPDHFDSAENFFKHLTKFAFYDDLMQMIKNENDGNDKRKIISCLLDENGLNYGNLPKGLLKFHQYPEGSKTPLEEHLTEGVLYACSKNRVRIEFTVSPEHITAFLSLLEKVKEKYESNHNVNFDINFSLQKESTDTVAVDMNNQAFRNADGTILFRPGGHGALIENLNDIDADIIFIKNIDNIVPDKLKNDTVTYKKLIAGLLIDIRNKTFEYIKRLDRYPNESDLNEVKSFLETTFSMSLDMKFDTRSVAEKIIYLRSKLNRPIRVCGMVKNEGEPGGGPFFVKKESGSVSLQIVEGAQIDMNNPQKADIVKHATHFNPVDLVLSIKDHEGKKFNLLHFIDSETGFISIKSKDGRDLKALELPGLWNGAMANWNTVFVEVPISTFNPVKTVNDLLREAHQG